MRMAPKGSPGTLILEIELAKPISRDKKVRVKLSWKNMLSLPLTGDQLQVDRALLTVTSAPASDDVLLDAPNSVPGGSVWRCRYDNDEWMTCVALTQILRNDPGVRSVAIVPRDER